VKVDRPRSNGVSGARRARLRPLVPKALSSPARPWRLSSALVLATSLQLSLLALGIGTISALDSRRSLEALAAALGRSISAQVRRELDILLEAPRLITRLNSAAIQTGQLDPENFPQLERTFSSQMEMFPVGYINYGNEAGEYLGVERLDDGRLRVNVMEAALGPRRQLVFDLRTGLRSSRPVHVYNDIGTAREEAWYRETVQRGRSTWSSIYQWDDKPEVLSISYNQPVRDRDGQLQGVIGADLILTQLNSRLRQIWGERPGLVLITERSGLLVASSDGQTVQAGPPGRPPRRLRLDQSPDPRLKKLGTLLLARADAGRLPARFQRLSRDDTFLEVIPWADRHGLDWLVLVLIPRNALAASLQPHSWLPLLLYLLALTLAILVSARLTRWILRPLRRVTEEAVQLADTVRRAPGETLSFRAALPPGSALEIQSLGNAISTLVTSLNGLVTAQRRSGQRLLREVQQKEQALQLSLQSQQRAEASNEARQSYLAHLNQEIRTPLGFVQGTTRLALAEPVSDSVRSHLLAIDDATRRMLALLELLDDAVDLAALPEGGAEPQELPFSLALLLQELSDLVAAQAQRRGLALTFTILPGSVDALVGDLRRLRQALLQGMASAIRRGGPGVIALSAATQAPGEGEASLPEDRRLRLRLLLRHPGALSEPGGMLGLAIARALLEGMGGSLQVREEPGPHTAIAFVVPLRAAAVPVPSSGSPPLPPLRAVALVGEAAQGERERLALLLKPLGLQPCEGPPEGPWALAVVQAAADPATSRLVVQRLRRELGPGVPIALLVRRLDRETFAAELQPPWQVLLDLPLHGPRLRAALAPLLASPAA
jgi:hypothetical protein